MSKAHYEGLSCPKGLAREFAGQRKCLQGRSYASPLALPGVRPFLGRRWSRQLGLRGARTLVAGGITYADPRSRVTMMVSSSLVPIPEVSSQRSHPPIISSGVSHCLCTDESPSPAQVFLLSSTWGSHSFSRSRSQS